MIRRFVLPLTLALAVGVALKALPDLARYLKMREM